MENIFLEVLKNLRKSKLQKTNPGPTRNNLALKYNLDFIEKDKFFNQIVEKIIGKKYEIVLKNLLWPPLRTGYLIGYLKRLKHN